MYSEANRKKEKKKKKVHPSSPNQLQNAHQQATRS
jgi:hypothetical protein